MQKNSMQGLGGRGCKGGEGVPTEDPLLADLRSFMLSHGQHDEDCGGANGETPSLLDPARCSCGFLPRMEELLNDTASRLKGLDR
jgi:hypothetical protein